MIQLLDYTTPMFEKSLIPWVSSGFISKLTLNSNKVILSFSPNTKEMSTLSSFCYYYYHSRFFRAITKSEEQYTHPKLSKAQGTLMCTSLPMGNNGLKVNSHGRKKIHLYRKEKTSGLRTMRSTAKVATLT